jgi:hypothetical protein
MKKAGVVVLLAVGVSACGGATTNTTTTTAPTQTALAKQDCRTVMRDVDTLSGAVSSTNQLGLMGDIQLLAMDTGALVGDVPSSIRLVPAQVTADLLAMASGKVPASVGRDARALGDYCAGVLSAPN